jgi:hypothetical protein
MLPSQAYANQFSKAEDKKYCEFTPKGILNALAMVFVMDNKIIATSILPFPALMTVIVAITLVLVGHCSTWHV